MESSVMFAKHSGGLEKNLVSLLLEMILYMYR